MSKLMSDVAFLDAPYQFVFKKEEINLDTIEAGNVICETLVSAISPGTEVAAYCGAKPLRPGVMYPRLVGYCNVAKVIHCGDDVTNIKVGDRVLTFSSHRSHFSIDANEVLAVLSDSIKNEDAVCAYLYHLGYDAILKSNVKLGSPVVVIGMGVLGLGAVAMASAAGANVVAISDHKIPAKIASNFGASAVFGRNDIKQLFAYLGERLADVVITTSGKWEDWGLALKAAGTKGYISVLGFPGRQEEEIPFNPLDSQYFYTKQLHIESVGLSPEMNDSRNFLKFNERNNLKFILDLIENEKLRPSELISGTFLWDELETAYQALIDRKESPITYILSWKK